MGKLTDQFIDALRKWGDLTGVKTQEISFWIFMWMGEEWVESKQYETQTETVREMLSLATTELALKTLQERKKLSEYFFIIGLIRAIEDKFRVRIESHDASSANLDSRTRATQEKLREIASDPVLFEAYKSDAENRRKEMLDWDLEIVDTEITPEGMLDLANSLDENRKENGKDSLSKLEDQIVIWRQVTAPILDSNNLGCRLF